MLSNELARAGATLVLILVSHLKLVHAHVQPLARAPAISGFAAGGTAAIWNGRGVWTWQMALGLAAEQQCASDAPSPIALIASAPEAAREGGHQAQPTVCRASAPELGPGKQHDGCGLLS